MTARSTEQEYSERSFLLLLRENYLLISQLKNLIRVDSDVVLKGNLFVLCAPPITAHRHKNWCYHSKISRGLLQYLCSTLHSVRLHINAGLNNTLHSRRVVGLFWFICFVGSVDYIAIWRTTPQQQPLKSRYWMNEWNCRHFNSEEVTTDKFYAFTCIFKKFMLVIQLTVLQSFSQLESSANSTKANTRCSAIAETALQGAL